MTTRNMDYSKIEPNHFFKNQDGKTKLNWFTFELACEIAAAVPARLKKALFKRGYTEQTFNKSCVVLAKALQNTVVIELRNEIREMHISYREVENAFQKLDDKIIDKLLNCTAKAWGHLLDNCISCPSACVSNKDDYCLMFDDKIHNEFIKPKAPGEAKTNILSGLLENWRKSGRGQKGSMSLFKPFYTRRKEIYQLWKQ